MSADKVTEMCMLFSVACRLKAVCRLTFQLQELRDIDNEVSWVTNFQYNNFLLRKSWQVPIELRGTICLLASEQHISLSPGQWTAHQFVSWPDSAQKHDPNRLWTLYVMYLFYVKSALDGMRSLPVVSSLVSSLIIDSSSPSCLSPWRRWRSAPDAGAVHKM